MGECSACVNREGLSGGWQSDVWDLEPVLEGAVCCNRFPDLTSFLDLLLGQWYVKGSTFCFAGPTRVLQEGALEKTSFLTFLTGNMAFQCTTSVLRLDAATKRSYLENY